MTGTSEFDPLDDLPHVVGSHPEWNESYYFFWSDRSSDLAGFSRIGVRTNLGYVEALHGMFLGGSRIGFAHQRRMLSEGGPGLHAGGLVFDCREPMQQWEIRFDGEIDVLDDGSVLEIPSKQRTGTWCRKEQLRLSLQFHSMSPPHGFKVSDGQQHFEHFGRVNGDLRIAAVEARLSGYGVRDKSWGPRTWKPALTGFSCAPGAPSTFIKWLVAPFGPDLAFAVIVAVLPNGEHRGEGLFLQDGTNGHLIDVRVTSTYRQNSTLHETVHLEGVANGRPFTIEGQVVNHIPTKIPLPGGATLVTEGLVRWRLPNGRTALGMAEYHVSVTRGKMVV